MVRFVSATLSLHVGYSLHSIATMLFCRLASSSAAVPPSVVAAPPSAPFTGISMLGFSSSSRSSATTFR
uniref:Putative secreted protein n=1 Tax=Anopheles triannulatus TaxID=58253 RepID=A0A2M4B5B0_9DIPT